ncbi:MAG: DnaJ domain-containing protein [Treponema sp.]|nr:DnaJ domain-containing protein [Treponema sp.]
MGIFSRLGTIINSYLNDFGVQTSRGYKPSGDPDYDAAYDELNDFLNGNEKRREPFGKTNTDVKLPPQELRDDFEKLGVPFGADEETCKTAYKKLLKVHHPDRHAGHEGNYKKATERAARINASWQRIAKWHQGGK